MVGENCHCNLTDFAYCRETTQELSLDTRGTVESTDSVCTRSMGRNILSFWALRDLEADVGQVPRGLW